MASRITYSPAALARATAVSSVVRWDWLKLPRTGSKSLHLSTNRTALNPFARIWLYLAASQVWPGLSLHTGMTLKPFIGTALPLESTNGAVGVACSVPAGEGDGVGAGVGLGVGVAVGGRAVVVSTT